MTTTDNHEALGRAVTQRREELDLSLRDAAALSRRIDVEINGQPTKIPGIGETTWMRIGQGEEAERFSHTLHLLDQTLRWPAGRARSILYGNGVGDEAPVADGPCSHAPAGLNGSVSELLNPTAPTVDADDRGAEIDLLRREVLRLIERVNGLENGLQQALARLQGRSN